MAEFEFEKLSIQDVDRVSDIENDSFSEPWSREAFFEILDSDFHRMYCLKKREKGSDITESLSVNGTANEGAFPSGNSPQKTLPEVMAEKTVAHDASSATKAAPQKTHLDLVTEKKLAPDASSTAEEGVIVGYIGYTAVLDEAEITNVAIDKKYRGRGYGSVLMDKLLEIISTEGISRVFLEVRAGNEPAKGLYRKHGFEKIGIRKNFYRFPTEDAIVMMKEL